METIWYIYMFSEDIHVRALKTDVGMRYPILVIPCCSRWLIEFQSNFNLQVILV